MNERLKAASPTATEAPWIARHERGSIVMMRIMIFLSLQLGRRIGRVVLHAIAAYFFLFAPVVRTHSRNYLARALGRKPGAADRYRLLLSFASTIHDRLFFIADRFDQFDIAVEGMEVVAGRFTRGEGAFLMGAHLGSFEVTRALGRRQPGLRVMMAMYENNARKINGVLAAVNPGLVADIIPLGTMDSMLRIRSQLDGGAFVGVLGDRTFGADRYVQVQFLGAPAHFPTSAMRAAALLRRPVIFMAGLYQGGNRYRIVFEELADFSLTTATEREAALAVATRRYAAVIERCCLSDPYNWFNFFDFWQLPATPAARES